MKYPYSRFVYGSTRLGDVAIPAEKRVELACAAMRTGWWFHTSTQYGDALSILGHAFRKDPEHIPSMIYKIGGDSIAELEQSIEDNLRPVGLDHMDCGQLCLGGNLAREFAQGGACLKALEKIRESGRVRAFLLEVFPWTSEQPYRALKAGHTKGLVDAIIFYLNPLQRFADNRLWDLILDTGTPVVALRTVSGGPVHRLRDEPGFAWKDYLRQRAVEVAPVFEASGIKSWTEFCARYSFSVPGVLATVGSTGRKENLSEYQTVFGHPLEPLPKGIMDVLFALQRRWSEEVDVHAEPWTM